MTSVQHRIVAHLEVLCRRFCRLSTESCGGCLGPLTRWLARPPGPELDPEAGDSPDPGALPPPSSGSHVPLNPSRFQLGVRCAFGPCDYLTPFEAATFLEPRLLEHPDFDTNKRVPLRPWQPEAKAVVVDLLRHWSESDRLRVFPARDCPAETRLRIQAVAKSVEVDRMICNRQARNAVEHSLEGASMLLPAVQSLADLRIPPGHELAIYCSDLQDMYHHFWVPEARSRTNAVAKVFSAADLQFAQEVRRRLAWRHVPLVGAFGSLPMGDGSAVDYACRAHEQLLLSAGALSADRQVLGQVPLPRSPMLQMVYIDDHCAMNVVPRGAPPEPSEAHRCFEASLAAYRAGDVCLPFRDSKLTKGEKAATVLGADRQLRRHTGQSAGPAPPALGGHGRVAVAAQGPWPSCPTLGVVMVVRPLVLPPGHVRPLLCVPVVGRFREGPCSTCLVGLGKGGALAGLRVVAHPRRVAPGGCLADNVCVGCLARWLGRGGGAARPICGV